MVMELKPMQKIMDNIASRHLDYIKSRGEKGISALKSLVVYEKVRVEDPDILGTLRTEYSIIEALASAMKAEIEMLTRMAAKQKAEDHLEFIKTNGERGRSVMADMVEFEELEKSEPNRYATLKTEYFILRTLTRAMREELIRMEEEEI